jgi:hypothetical protein
MGIIFLIFGIPLCISLILAVLGLIKPALVKQKSRIKAFSIFFGAALALLIAMVIVLAYRGYY